MVVKVGCTSLCAATINYQTQTTDLLMTQMKIRNVKWWFVCRRAGSDDPYL